MHSTRTHRKYQDPYARIASELSGQAVSLDKWNQNQAQRNHLLEQTHSIAQKLEGEGIPCYDENQDLYLMGLHTRQYKKLPNFRNIAFLPVVAQKQRQSKLKSLQYLLQHHPNCRMWTITTGSRVNCSQAQGRVQDMHRKVSRINSEGFMKRAGVRFIFRSTEFGEVVEIPGQGLSLHPHCHAVLKMDRFVSREEWSKLIARIRGYFGAHCQDNGRIKEPREFVKYCVKPSDLEALSAPALVDLYNLCSSLRLVECLQDLRKLRRDIRECDHTLIRKKGILRRVPKWNTGAKLKKDESRKVLEDVFRHWTADGDPVPSPSIVAWCAPASVFAPVTEPLFLVNGLDGRDPSLMFMTEEVKSMAVSIKVHTKALTVRRDEQKKGITSHIQNESKSKVPPKYSETVGIR